MKLRKAKIKHYIWLSWGYTQYFVVCILYYLTVLINKVIKKFQK